MSKNYPTRTLALVRTFNELLQQKIESYTIEKKLDHLVFKSTDKFNFFINATIKDLANQFIQNLQDLDEEIIKLNLKIFMY